MTPRWPLTLAALFLPRLALAAPASSEPLTRPSAESKPVEKDGVAITVSMKQQTIAADEQPWFVVHFRNTSGDYINLYDVMAFWDWQIEFTSADDSVVNPGPWRLRMDKISLRGPFAHRQIKPGESTEIDINLNDPPFTFDYIYAGEMDRLVAPVRHLRPGTYRMSVTIKLPNPFGPGYHQWVGPLTTAPVEFRVSETATHAAQPTAQELGAYNAAIDHVIGQLGPDGLWLNGVAPDIKLPAQATPEDVIASAVNRHVLGSKAYRILHVRPADQLHRGAKAALVEVGGKPKVVVFFPFGNDGWWTRFYDTQITVSTTQPSR